MDNAAVVSGSLVDVKNINTHKVVRLSIDIPAEQGAKIVEAFGWPTMVDPVDVAVARISITPSGAPAQNGVSHTSDSKPKSYAQRAGILSQDHAFWRFISERSKGVWYMSGYGDDAPANADEWAADYIRSVCDVSSRSELLEGTEAGRRFRDLEAEFKAWKMVDA